MLDNLKFCPVCTGPLERIIEYYGGYYEDFCWQGCIAILRDYNLYIRIGTDNWMFLEDQKNIPFEMLLDKMSSLRKSRGKYGLEHLAFLDSVAKDRYDSELRSVFADWLDEYGAEFESFVHRFWNREKQEAEDWLRTLAARGGVNRENYMRGIYHDGRIITYGDVVSAGRYFIEGGRCYIQYGEENLRDIICNPTTIEEYWKNWSIVTGILTDKVDESPFTCSC